MAGGRALFRMLSEMMNRGLGYARQNYVPLVRLPALSSNIVAVFGRFPLLSAGLDAYWLGLGALPLTYELWYKPKLQWQAAICETV
jgi:hypothetical protein